MKPKSGRAVKISAVLVSFVLAGIIFMILSKRSDLNKESREKENAANEGPRVMVMRAEESPPERKLVLVGQTRAFNDATVYAKVSGYLKSIYVDKGDRVRKDQVLGVIESPETDKTYESYLADWQNKARVAKRMSVLEKKKLISPQEAEQAYAAADVAQGILQAEGEIKSYEILRAPFSGTVTARFADPGALVQNATAGQSGALPLVTISETDELRCFVYVPQKDANFVNTETRVSLSLYENPEEMIEAHVQRISGELDPSTRMLLAEIDIDNHEQKIVSGSFLRVAMTVKSPPFISVPVEALIHRTSKNPQEPSDWVAKVSGEDKVQFVPIQIIENNGEKLRVSGAIKAGEKIALNIGNSVAEGARIRTVEVAGPTGLAGQSGEKKK